MMRRTLFAKMLYFGRSVIYIGALLGLLLFTLYFVPASVRYHVTETYRFEGVAGDGYVRLGVLLPISGPYQTVSAATVTWDGDEAVEHGINVDVAKLTASLAAGETKVARFDYDVVLPQGRAVWDAPALDFQRAPQPKIESDDPRIVSQAGRLVDGDVTVWQNVRQIYSFVAGYLAWPAESRINVSPTAVDALESGVGGCEEFANLMTALCRASGIPAQTISGLYFPGTLVPFVTYSGTWSHPAGAHAWVEVYTEDGWSMADPSHGSRLRLLQARIFGRNDGRHLSYGENETENHTYAQMQAWVETNGELIGGMSAPLKFAASSNAADVLVTPSVTVQKSWDGTWFNFAASFVVAVVVLRLIEDRWFRSPTSV